MKNTNYIRSSRLFFCCQRPILIRPELSYYYYCNRPGPADWTSIVAWFSWPIVQDLSASPEQTTFDAGIALRVAMFTFWTPPPAARQHSRAAGENNSRNFISFIIIHRGVATAGETGDASPVRPTMSPYIKVTTDSLSSKLTFDEWRGVILQRTTRPTLPLHVIKHYTT